MRILFINKTRTGSFRAFDAHDIEGMRGGERTMMYLAEALGRRGHEVVVACAGISETVALEGFSVAGPEVALARDYDVAISNNYAAAFDSITAPVKIVWTHNPGFSRSHIVADYLAKLRHRPNLVHLSRYTLARSWLLPRSGQTIIRHGMPSALLAARQERQEAPPPVAVFSSYAGRNLRKVIQAWRDVVNPRVPEARLLVTSEAQPKHLDGLTPQELAAINIEVIGTLPWTELMVLLRSARVFVAPGHWQETFNLLTVEAAACGVPTVTMGIGALRERVLHDETGWTAGSVREMGEALARVLTDDALWYKYHRACLQHPDIVSWEERAAEWERHMLALCES
jgi:glycosyltransferase involved in cell wall biosynthesis